MPQTYGGSSDVIDPALVTEISGGEPSGDQWTTGFYKQPVQGPVQFFHDHVQGDGVADRTHHGGLNKAVLAYSVDHYADWCVEWNCDRIPFGAFGENLSVVGLTEEDVCIGDVWRLGEVRLQVSQPRQPCWKLGRRWSRPTLPKSVIATGRTGWYLRVIAEGFAGTGPLILEQRIHADWSIGRCNRVAYDRSDSVDVRTWKRELASVPELSLSWRESLAK